MKDKLVNFKYSYYTGSNIVGEITTHLSKIHLDKDSDGGSYTVYVSGHGGYCVDSEVYNKLFDMLNDVDSIEYL